MSHHFKELTQINHSSAKEYVKMKHFTLYENDIHFTKKMKLDTDFDATNLNIWNKIILIFMSNFTISECIW